MIRTAMPALDVRDILTGDRYSLFRCNECCALVLCEDARDHLSWHAALVYRRQRQEIPR